MHLGRVFLLRGGSSAERDLLRRARVMALGSGEVGAGLCFLPVASSARSSTLLRMAWKLPLCARGSASGASTRSSRAPSDKGDGRYVRRRVRRSSSSLGSVRRAPPRVGNGSWEELARGALWGSETEIATALWSWSRAGGTHMGGG